MRGEIKAGDKITKEGRWIKLMIPCYPLTSLTNEGYLLHTEDVIQLINSKSNVLFSHMYIQLGIAWVVESYTLRFSCKHFSTYYEAVLKLQTSYNVCTKCGLELTINIVKFKKFLKLLNNNSNNTVTTRQYNILSIPGD